MKLGGATIVGEILHARINRAKWMAGGPEHVIVCKFAVVARKVFYNQVSRHFTVRRN